MTPELIDLVAAVLDRIPECRPDGRDCHWEHRKDYWVSEHGPRGYDGEPEPIYETDAAMLERLAWLAMVWLWSKQDMSFIALTVNSDGDEYGVSQGEYSMDDRCEFMDLSRGLPAEAVLRAALAVADREPKP